MGLIWGGGGFKGAKLTMIVADFRHSSGMVPF